MNNGRMSKSMPAIFIGHGNPMNALQNNTYTQAWSNLGKSIPRPEAILAISAHWYQPGIAVTANLQPPTIHDFGGFPKALYEFEYPAPGSPQLAERVQHLLNHLSVKPDTSWGLDHGVWSVLCHLFPQADIPVVQLQIDSSKPADFHYVLGKQLAQLRDENILILGSGNLVHNLRLYAWGKQDTEAYDWAVSFEKKAIDLLRAGEHPALIDYETLGPEYRLAIPTADHYLPLLYVLGASRQNEPVSFPVSGVEGGSISMLTVQIG